MYYRQDTSDRVRRRLRTFLPDRQGLYCKYHLCYMLGQDCHSVLVSRNKFALPTSLRFLLLHQVPPCIFRWDKERCQFPGRRRPALLLLEKYWETQPLAAQARNKFALPTSLRFLLLHQVPPRIFRRDKQRCRLPGRRRSAVGLLEKKKKNSPSVQI